MKKEEEILSKITGYSVQELHERLTEPILQPYDCLMAMIEFAEQQVKNLNIPAVMLSLPSQDEIDEQIDKYAFRVPYDGSNNFYDEVSLKHYKAGIEWLLGRIRDNGA